MDLNTSCEWEIKHSIGKSNREMLAPLGFWCSSALSCISPACAECMDLLGLCALFQQ